MPIPNNDEMTALEVLVDKCSLFEVLAALHIICSDKADHIRASYDDKQTARCWEQAGKAILNCAQHDSIERVS